MLVARINMGVGLKVPQEGLYVMQGGLCEDS